ncbi:hypothetical protein HNQ56_001148 [Anaerotaenia torta]|uniref:hypothetical protein n=1 Tax=Anaerotaenia torta TaxID=433293 RepID=UPI003D2181C8
MADTSWTNNPRLNNIDPRKLSILLDLMKEVEGKSMDQVFPLLMNTNKRLQEQNMAFSKDESDIMIEILTKNMTPKEKSQFEMVRKMMASRKT